MGIPRKSVLAISMATALTMASASHAKCPFETVIGCQEPGFILLPNSSSERLQEELLVEFNAGSEDPTLQQKSFRIARNEIYARHGYIFQDQDLQAYFDARSWYRPVSRKVELNKIEQYNISLISKLEKNLKK